MLLCAIETNKQKYPSFRLEKREKITYIFQNDRVHKVFDLHHTVKIRSVCRVRVRRKSTILRERFALRRMNKTTFFVWRKVNRCTILSKMLWKLWNRSCLATFFFLVGWFVWTLFRRRLRIVSFSLFFLFHNFYLSFTRPRTIWDRNNVIMEQKVYNHFLYDVNTDTHT